MEKGSYGKGSYWKRFVLEKFRIEKSSFGIRFVLKRFVLENVRMRNSSYGKNRMENGSCCKRFVYQKFVYLAEGSYEIKQWRRELDIGTSVFWMAKFKHGKINPHQHLGKGMDVTSTIFF